MAAHAAPNILLDTSSSNDWIRIYGGLAARRLRARARLPWSGTADFGTDSSFFPRGWQRGVCDIQRAILEDLAVAPTAQALVFSGNFSRVFGIQPSRNGIGRHRRGYSHPRVVVGDGWRERAGQSADLVRRNGRILTLDAALPRRRRWRLSSAIVAVGSNADMDRFVGSNTQVIDLGAGSHVRDSSKATAISTTSAKAR